MLYDYLFIYLFWITKYVNTHWYLISIQIYLDLVMFLNFQTHYILCLDLSLWKSNGSNMNLVVLSLTINISIYGIFLIGIQIGYSFSIFKSQVMCLIYEVTSYYTLISKKCRQIFVWYLHDMWMLLAQILFFFNL